MPHQTPDWSLWASLLAGGNGTVPASANVFISYAREDRQFVDHLYDALRQTGYALWLDRESIPGSSEWLAEINKGIDNAKAVIVVLSPAACASRFVEQELRYAQNLNRPIVPILFQPCQLSYGMSWLGRVQWVDFAHETFLGALQRLDLTLKQFRIAPSTKSQAPVSALQLSQVIPGNWEIDMVYQQRKYRLQVILVHPSSFSGLVFTPPPEIFSYMPPAPDMLPYAGSWSLQEPREVLFDGHVTGVPSMQQNPWQLTFYIQSISNDALSGFGLPDRAPCAWRRWS